MNTQVRLPKDEGALHVHSIFNTIQGEGPSSGCPATFIRLNGCNLQCALCDTEYTTQRLYVGSALGFVEEHMQAAPLPLVVITGGEPLRQGERLSELVTTILSFYPHVEIEIESNGIYSFQSLMHQNRMNSHRITPIIAPKIGAVNKWNIEFCDVYKLLISAANQDKDGWPDRTLGGQCGSQDNETPFSDEFKRMLVEDAELGGVKVYVHPEDYNGQLHHPIYLENQKAAVDFVKRYPHFRLGCQLHKYYGLD